MLFASPGLCEVLSVIDCKARSGTDRVSWAAPWHHAGRGISAPSPGLRIELVWLFRESHLGCLGPSRDSASL